MTVQYCSDLHLEFPANADFLTKNPIIPKGEILLLAGDVVPFAVMNKHNTFFDKLSDQFERIYWIPGNHEFYHSDLLTRRAPRCEKIRENVFLVNNWVVEQDHVRFVFSTLWSAISPTRQWEIQQGMADFQVIRYGDSRFLPHHFNELHQESLDFIERTLKQEWAGKTIMITHHVPTFFNYPTQYKGSVLNEAFATELSNLIIDSKADYWIYGHHHQVVPEFTVGTAKLITNQLGYVKYNEHKGFDRNKFIDI